MKSISVHELSGIATNDLIQMEGGRCKWMDTKVSGVGFKTRGKRDSMMCEFNSRREDNQRLRSSDSAKDILDKRYALGEISKEEYEERKRNITRTNS